MRNFIILIINVELDFKRKVLSICFLILGLKYGFLVYYKRLGVYYVGIGEVEIGGVLGFVG